MNPQDRLYVIAIPLAIGIIVSLLARASTKRRMQWKTTASIVMSDYTFENYATISVASFVYAILQGGLTGAAIGSIAIAGIDRDWHFVGVAVLLLAGILLVRLSIEGYIALYKTARDASMFFTLSSRQILKRDSTLQVDYGKEFIPFNATARKIQNPKNAKEVFSEIMQLLQRNGIQANDASLEKSYISETFAIISREDGSDIVEIRIDSENGLYALLLDDGGETILN